MRGPRVPKRRQLCLVVGVIVITGCASHAPAVSTALSPRSTMVSGVTPPDPSVDPTAGGGSADPLLPAQVGCVPNDPSADSQDPPTSTMDIGTDSISVTAIWESTTQYSCPHTVGGAGIAHKLAADFNASAPGYLGTRECPAGTLHVVLRFRFTSAKPPQDVDLVIDGCNGAYGPGPNGTNAYVAVNPDVFEAVEPLAPPSFLPDVVSDARP